MTPQSADGDASPPTPLRVLRVYHSAVVGPWRRRERELRALGVDVEVVSPRSWDEGGREVVLDDEREDFVIVAPTRGRHPYAFVYDPRPIWRALREHRPDVVDIHEEPASLAAGEVWLLARLARPSAQVTLYSAQNLAKRYPIPFRWIERGLLRRVAGVHTCNDQAGRILRSKGFSGALCNLGLGVDVEHFTPAPDAGGSGDLRVGYVGRLEDHKGVDVLVRAVARTPGTRLDVVGDGSARIEVERAARDSGAADRIHVDGFVANADLPAQYRRFDVVAVPSLDTPSWVEQFGRVAVEAMASGAVVVASRSGALPDVVGDAGLLVAPGDADALADALARLRDDESLRRDLQAAGRQRAQRYAWPAIARRQAEFYAGLECSSR